MPGRRGLALLVVTSILVACVAERPLVERLERDDWQPAPFQVTSMGGQRAGAQVTFVLRLEGPTDRRLVVEGTVVIDPQARLVSGRWSEDGTTSPASGIVSSASVDFFGGQGDRPSLGGQFTLAADGAPVYRLNLPATRLSAER